MTNASLALLASLAIVVTAGSARADSIPPDVTLTGHTGRINSVAFSPDGKKLASVSDDGHLKIWDLATQHELFDCEGAANNQNQVRFSADGKTVVALGSENNILVIDVVAAKPRPPIALTDMTGGGAGLDVSPDGKNLAVVGRGTLRLFDVATGAAKATYEVHKSYQASAVAFSIDGSKLATVGSDNTALVIDPATGKVQQTFKLEAHGLAVAFSVDGKTLFTYSDDHVLRSFDIASGETQKLLHDGTPLTTLTVAKDGKTLVLGGAGRGPVLLSLPYGFRVNEDYAGDDRVMAASLSPDDQWIAGGANEGAIYLWKRKH